MLDSVIVSALEIRELDASEEWMWDRYVEVRKLVKTLLQNERSKNWFDMLLVLQQLIVNFNSQVGDELCVSDLIDRFVMSKTQETVAQMLSVVRDSLTNSNSFPN